METLKTKTEDPLENEDPPKKKKKKKMQIHEFHFLVNVCVLIFATKTLHQ